jgi:hypothetical protein
MVPFADVVLYIMIEKCCQAAEGYFSGIFKQLSVAGFRPHEPASLRIAFD